MFIFDISNPLTLILMLAATVLLIFLAQEILQLWLGYIPDYSVGMIQLVLICSYVRSVHNPIDTLFKASGKLKNYQIGEGILLSCPLLFAWLIFLADYSIFIAFSTLIIFEFANLLFISYLSSKILLVNLKIYYKKIIFPMLLYAVFVAMCYFFKERYIVNWLYSLLISVLIDIVCVIFLYISILDRDEKVILRNLI